MTAEDLAVLVEGLAPAVRHAIAAELAPLLARLAALETRAPIPGRDGRDGQTGQAGAAGEDGRDGAAGADGRDGLGFDDLAVVPGADARSFTLEFRQADRVRAFPVTLPALIYRGVYDEARAYGPGDTVTYGGHLWHANEPTTARPDEHTAEGVRAWTLCVRRGRDGKVGKAGPEGRAGHDGKDGIRY